MAGNRHEIDTKHINLGWYLAYRLRGICVKQNTGFMGDARAFLDGLDSADLVVGMHDADEDGSRRDRASQVVRIDLPGAIDRQVSDLRAYTFEKTAGFENRRMLNAGGDNMIALAAQCEERAFERQVVSSLPPLVKTISSWLQPSSSAT